MPSTISLKCRPRWAEIRTTLPVQGVVREVNPEERLLEQMLRLAQPGKGSPANALALLSNLPKPPPAQPPLPQA